MVSSYYLDPISEIWSGCVRRLGWSIERSNDVFASWDGHGTITIGQRADLDPDDHLGQLVLHELCHALIEGPEKWVYPDWGLENTDARHLANELACHRLQAHLADHYDLRDFFAATTDWRPYFDCLPKEAMTAQDSEMIKNWSHSFRLEVSYAQRLDQEAVLLATQGLQRAQALSWLSELRSALHTTRQVRELVSSYALPQSIWLNSQ